MQNSILELPVQKYDGGLAPYSPNTWIALIFIGSSNPYTKASTAADAGAAGVIIVEPGSSPMQLTFPSTIGIPCVSVNNATGYSILSYIQQCLAPSLVSGSDQSGATANSSCMVLMDIKPVVNNNSDSNLIPQATALILCIVFFTLCCFLYFRRNSCSCHSRQRQFYHPQHVPNDVMQRIIQRQQSATARRSVAAAAAIDALPMEIVQPDDEVTAEEKDVCAICLDAFVPGTYVRRLPCNHLYHKECIDPWLADHGTCPLCKATIIEASAPNDEPMRLNERELYFLILTLHLRRGRRLPPELEAEYLAMLATFHEPPPIEEELRVVVQDDAVARGMDEESVNSDVRDTDNTHV